MLARSELAAIRFGTGLPAGTAGDADGLLAEATGPDTAAQARPGLTMADAAAFRNAGAAAADRIKAEKNSDASRKALEEVQAKGRAMVLGSARVAMARALDAPLGFRERLVRFWADHFTVRAKSRFVILLPAAFVEEAIRPHVSGRFADMARASTLHPAMLDYLDQMSSVGPGSKLGKRRKRGLNENLARELIELHTLGVGAGYSQADVRQLAELLTGLTIDDQTAFAFRKEMAEPGDETVLGVTYSGKGLDPIVQAIDDLAARPETAAHIARKLVVHFVTPDPDPGHVAQVQRAFSESGGDLPAVYRALLDHPAAWAPDLRKARQPFEFVTAALRALGFDGDTVMQMSERNFRRSLFVPMAGMGQPWMAPLGPNGWPEEIEAWITPQLLAGRVAWAMQEPRRLMKDLPDPARTAARALGENADGKVLWAAQRAETRPEGIGVIFASPAFNRR
jgi:uncharacterized protein (DUF1800 family)